MLTFAQIDDEGRMGNLTRGPLNWPELVGGEWEVAPDGVAKIDRRWIWNRMQRTWTHAD